MPTFSLQQAHADLDHHNAQLLIRIARETGDTPLTTTTQGATAGGDERKLRGIPCLAKGCGSAIQGTSPLQALLHKHRNDDR